MILSTSRTKAAVQKALGVIADKILEPQPSKIVSTRSARTKKEGCGDC